MTVGAYNPAKNIVELEGLDGTFAQTVGQRCFEIIFIVGGVHVYTMLKLFMYVPV